MAQKIALGFLLDKIMKDLTANMNQEHKNKIEKEVNSKLVSVFGTNWSRLPVTGPRMMAAIFVLNLTLIPFGIVPATLFDVAIKKSKEYDVEDRFIQALQNTKQGSGLSKTKINEILNYAGEAGENVKHKLKKLGDEAGGTLNKLITRSKGAFGKISSKTRNKQDEM